MIQERSLALGTPVFLSEARFASSGFHRTPLRFLGVAESMSSGGGHCCSASTYQTGQKVELGAFRSGFDGSAREFDQIRQKRPGI
jgi:hypothetical protein